MIKPNIPVEDFVRKYGFRYCKKPYNSCAYLCMARGCEMIFVSPQMVAIVPWEENDPRIHKKANCRYSDKRTALEIFYLLVKNNAVMWDMEG